MDSRLLVALSIIAVVIVYAVLSTYWTSRNREWYAALPRPSWRPPDIVFAVIWPLNFLALGIAGWVMGYGQSRISAITYGVTLTGSVVFSLGWAYLFYVPHHLGMAAVSLTVASLLTWSLFYIAFSAQAWVGVLLLPYALWLTIATTLAYGYAYLVPNEERARTFRSRR